MADGRLSTEDMVTPVPRDAEQDVIDLDDSTSGTTETTDVPLLDDVEADAFLSRWSDVQTRFVDDPQAAVRDGDSLVAEVMQAVAQRFAQHKRELEEQWTRGEKPGTEELRLALQEYRSFFERLLST